jgi:hypothetical protein
VYVAYAMGVALFVTLWTSFNVFFENVSTGVQITVIVLATIILAPFLFALSKIIWANMFMAYDPHSLDINEKSVH